MNKTLKNSGITLIEILVSIIIFSAVMLIATSMIIQSFNIINRSSETVGTKQLSEIMLKDLTNNLRQINSYNQDEFTNNNNIWEFTINDNDTDVNLKIILSGDELKMKHDNEDIRIIENVQKFDIEKNENRFIIELEIIDETGQTINKRREVLSRNI